MNDELLLGSLSAHLDAADRLLSWALVASCVALVAGASGGKQVGIGKLIIARRHAFWALSLLFVVVNALVFLDYWKLATLVSRVGNVLPTEAPRAFSALSFHASPFNPFAYYGSDSYVEVGSFVLVFTWWVASAAVFSFADLKVRKDVAASIPLLLLLIVCGGLCLASIDAVSSEFQRLSEAGYLPGVDGPTHERHLRRSFRLRIAGLGVGSLVFFGVLGLQAFVAARQRKAQVTLED